LIETGEGGLTIRVVAVGRGARDMLGPHIHGAAADILDDDRLRPRLGKLVGEQARERVGGRAARRRHHQPDGARREDVLRAGVIRLPDAADGKQSDRGQATEWAHRFLPDVS